ncbi:hypothetical protein AAG906_021765 [Vitis piasezkii]
MTWIFRKNEYLIEAIIVPPLEDLKFKTWKLENSMVMSCLINSMTNEISEDFKFYETTKEVSDAAKETYLDKENTSELFEVKRILNDLKQGELTVTQYFNALNRCWQHLDLFNENELDCPNCCRKYKKFAKKESLSSCSY